MDFKHILIRFMISFKKEADALENDEELKVWTPLMINEIMKLIKSISLISKYIRDLHKLCFVKLSIVIFFR